MVCLFVCLLVCSFLCFDFVCLACLLACLFCLIDGLFVCIFVCLFVCSSIALILIFVFSNVSPQEMVMIFCSRFAFFVEGGRRRKKIKQTKTLQVGGCSISMLYVLMNVLE